MIDKETIVLYGWKITDNIDELQNELEIWCEDWIEETQDIIVDDPMCNNYIYFGAIIGKYDVIDGGEIIVDNNLIKNAVYKWNKFLEINSEFENIILKYKNIEPKLYVFQRFW